MSKKFDPGKAIEQLKQHGFGKYKCPLCGNNTFSCQDDPVTLLLTSDLSTIEMKTYVPAILVSCNKCGHVDFFSVLKLNAYVEEPDSNEQEQRK